MNNKQLVLSISSQYIPEMQYAISTSHNFPALLANYKELFEKDLSTSKNTTFSLREHETIKFVVTVSTLTKINDTPFKQLYTLYRTCTPPDPTKLRVLHRVPSPLYWYSTVKNRKVELFKPVGEYRAFKTTHEVLRELWIYENNQSN